MTILNLLVFKNNILCINYEVISIRKLQNLSYVCIRLFVNVVTEYLRAINVNGVVVVVVFVTEGGQGS